MPLENILKNPGKSLGNVAKGVAIVAISDVISRLFTGESIYSHMGLNTSQTAGFLIDSGIGLVEGVSLMYIGYKLIKYG